MRYLRRLIIYRFTTFHIFKDFLSEETQDGENFNQYTDLLVKTCNGIMKQFEKKNTSRLFASRNATLVSHKNKATVLNDLELITWLTIKQFEKWKSYGK